MKKGTLILVMVLIAAAFFSVALGTYVFIKYKTNNTKERLLQIAASIVNYDTQTEELNLQNKELEERKITKEELELNDNVIGILKIPKINLEAPIKEGTEQDILKYAIGHFIESRLFYGNVVLAAHNQGIYSHYFERINELSEKDEIIYLTKFGEKTYKVIQTKIIEDTDWSVIENTEKDLITLITCIRSRANFRLCVIGEKI